MKNEILFKGGRAGLFPAARHTGKKLTVFLLSFCLLLSNLSCGTVKEVYASDGKLTENVEIDNVVYKEIEPGKMKLVEWKAEIESAAEIVIPGTVTYNGKEYTVVSIGDSAFAYKYIRKVTFPDTIESIGQEAFRSCGDRGVLELTLPGNLKEIGRDAFWNSYISGELVIPDSVTFIGSQAFRATKISGVIISNPDIVYGEDVFADNQSLVSIKLPEGISKLGGAAFLRGCTGLTQIDLPDSITYIPKSALSGCTGLTQIEIPSAVNKIDESAFYGCTGLKEIVVPDGITELLVYTFRACSEELRVILPDSITSVHSRTFFEGVSEKDKYSTTLTVSCTSREVAALVAAVGHKNILLNGEAYETKTFEINGYTYTVTDSENKYVQLDKWAGTQPSGEVAIPKTVTYEGEDYTVKTIGESAFYGCTEITKVTLPDTLTGMGTRVFMSCRKLTSVNLPDGITRIEQMMFYRCPLQEELKLPSNLQYIGSYAFGDCTGLQKIEIPGSCTVVGTGAFADCTGITEVTLSEGIIEMGSNIFGGCTGIKKIQLPDSIQTIGGYAFWNCTELEEIQLNQSLTEIGIGIFSGCEKLTGTMVLPDSVKIIGRDAFVDSSLTRVHVGSGLTILESRAFPDSIRLTANSLEVWKLLSRNTDRINAPEFLWDGTCDIPDEIHAYVEGDIIIADSVMIGDAAVVTFMPDASLTVDGTLTNNGMVEGEGAITVNGTFLNNGTVVGRGAITVNGKLTNNGTIEREGAFTVNGVITGSGTFGEGIQVTFLLTEDMVADVDDAVYSAAPLVPEPEISTVFAGEKIIFEKNVDYTYSYANNIIPGTADVTVTPKAGGKLTGEAVTTHFTIGKDVQTVPVCSLSYRENEDGQTLTAEIVQVEGAEYSFDGENWGDENTKKDCQPDREYTAYIRMKETATHSASGAAQKTLRAPKLKQNAPEECLLTYRENEDGQTLTAEIVQVEGAEYSFDG
ncbi:leucine-rich repeat domain-containing protein, partial [Lachnospiraceae bacterium 45-W7]